MESQDLRKAGLKVTLPRLKILEILETTQPRHMSAEEIYKRLIESHEDIACDRVPGIDTVRGAGLVTRHHFENGMAVFELNQGSHHQTLVCLDCGHVESSSIRTSKTPGQHRQAGLRDQEHSLVLYGHCQRNGCPRRRRAAG
jgi:Fur family ferric uptake transcriptional regulator